MKKANEDHTPGPYNVRIKSGRGDIGIYSEATGECVAHALSTTNNDRDGPRDQTALNNAVLFSAAPRMHESLRLLLVEEHQRISTPTQDKVRSLLADMDAARARLREERMEERRLYEESLQAQIMEMARQTRNRPEPPNVAEQEQEDQDNSFGW